MKRATTLGLTCVLVLGFAGGTAVAAGLPGTTAADRLVYQKLDTTIVSFTFNEQPLEEALDFLQTLGKVNIVLDKRKVEAGKTITLKLSDVALVTAVRLLTEQVALKWIVRDGVVYISDEEGTKQEPITMVYTVDDLLAVPPNFEGPTFELQNISGNRGGSSGGGGGGSSIFTDTGTGTGGAGETEEQKKSREELLTELVDLIKQVIEPGTWE